MPDRTRSLEGPEIAARSLCRVEWWLGQALVPEHFFWQEISLRQESELRFQQLSPPAWGVSQLEWDEELLTRGFFKIRRLFLVLPRVQVVHVPGNAKIVTEGASDAFELNKTNALKVTLYAHVLTGSDVDGGDPLSDDPAALRLLVQRVLISAEPTHPEASRSLRLIELEKQPETPWALVPTTHTAASGTAFLPNYVPPLLRLDAFPGFFPALAKRLSTLIHLWQEILRADMESNSLSTLKLVRAGECLRRSYLLQAFLCQIDPDSVLRDLDAGPQSVLPVHPYDFHCKLLELYVDLSSYQSDLYAEPPALLGQTYDHSAIVASFGPLLDEIARRAVRPTDQVPYSAFELRGRIAACPIPNEARTAKEVYWLLHRRGPAVTQDLRAVKLASTGRLEAVHRLSLKGVPFRHVERVGFRHDFSSEVEFHLLSTGEEWEHVLREGTLAYFEEGPVAQARSYLFWRG